MDTLIAGANLGFILTKLEDAQKLEEAKILVKEGYVAMKKLLEAGNLNISKDTLDSGRFLIDIHKKQGRSQLSARVRREVEELERKYPG